MARLGGEQLTKPHHSPTDFPCDFFPEAIRVQLAKNIVGPQKCSARGISSSFACNVTLFREGLLSVTCYCQNSHANCDFLSLMLGENYSDNLEMW